MAQITIRGLTLGAGAPCRILVPIMQNTAAAAAAAAAALQNGPGDLVELRLDALRGLGTAALCDCLLAVRAALGPRPLLATVRTAREGGLADITPADYAVLCAALCATGAADLIDVELSAGGAATAAVQAAARAAGMVTVFSSHDFAKTPPVAEMVATLRRMGDAGADIAKLAVMPRTPADAAALLQATAQAAAAMPDVPLITMAMGALGVVTRLCGGAFGSAASFGTAGRASAPGQPDAQALRGAMDAMAGAGAFPG